jgi:hypothetical protein
MLEKLVQEELKHGKEEAQRKVVCSDPRLAQQKGEHGAPGARHPVHLDAFFSGSFRQSLHHSRASAISDFI